jgi:hypothetical protein
VHEVGRISFILIEDNRRSWGRKRGNIREEKGRAEERISTNFE